MNKNSIKYLILHRLVLNYIIELCFPNKRSFSLLFASSPLGFLNFLVNPSGESALLFLFVGGASGRVVPHPCSYTAWCFKQHNRPCSLNIYPNSGART